MRFVCEGQAYDTSTMRVFMIPEHPFDALYVQENPGGQIRVFVQTFDDQSGVRIRRAGPEQYAFLAQQAPAHAGMLQGALGAQGSSCLRR